MTGGVVLSADEAQHNVEFLCQRFSTLFAQVDREEAEVKAIETRNVLLEQKLAHIRQQDLTVRAEADERFNTTVELRREAEHAERRSALGSDEVEVLSSVAAVYARQAERLHDRCREEAAREKNASAALARRAEELQELRQQRGVLVSELASAEAERERVAGELRLVSQGTLQTSRDVGSLEQRLQEDRNKGEASEALLQSRREDVAGLDRMLSRAHADLGELTSRLEGERTQSRTCEDRFLQLAERRAGLEEELCSLSAQLSERRREGSKWMLGLGERARETQRLQERLQAEQHLQSQEQQTSDAAHARRGLLRTELQAAERELKSAEGELLQLRRRAAELEERCTTQRRLLDELQRKQCAGKSALERLREELRILQADRARLQHEVDEVTRERTRLEVEVEVTAPALRDARRRCRDLEDHLVVRVRELAEEVEKVRRYRAEARSARDRAQALGRHTEMLGTRLLEHRDFDENRAERFDLLNRLGRQERAGFATTGGSAADSLITPIDRGAGALGDSAPARSRAVVCACSNVFMPDSAFCRKCGARRPKDTSNREEELFDRIDSNKDGVISRGEFGRALRAGEVGQQCAFDAVRFLCDFVAREEERLGLAPAAPPLAGAAGDTPATLGTPRTPCTTDYRGVGIGLG